MEQGLSTLFLLRNTTSTLFGTFCLMFLILEDVTLSASTLPNYYNYIQFIMFFGSISVIFDFNITEWVTTTRKQYCRSERIFSTYEKKKMCWTVAYYIDYQTITKFLKASHIWLDHDVRTSKWGKKVLKTINSLDCIPEGSFKQKERKLSRERETFLQKTDSWFRIKNNSKIIFDQIQMTR